MLEYQNEQGGCHEGSRLFRSGRVTIGIVGQPARAQNAASAPNGTFVGQALGTALVTLRDTVTGNAVDAVYSVTGRVTVDVEGSAVTLTYTKFVLTPPNGFVKPVGYSGPTTSFTIGQFNSQATRTPANYATLTEPWYSDHGGDNISVNINPILRGHVGLGPTVRVNGVIAGSLTNGTMNVIADVSGGGQVEISTTFIAVATQ